MSLVLKYLRGLGILALTLAACSLPAHAADATVQHIGMKGKSFDPVELDVPSGQKIKISIKNDTDTAAEFESDELEREKVVPAHDEVTFYVGPLDPGTYPFFNDFDPAKAQGRIVAK